MVSHQDLIRVLTIIIFFQLDAMTEDSMPVSVAQKCQYNPVVTTCKSEQSSFENSVAENNLMEEPSYKSLRLEGDMDSQEHVLYKDSHMPISGLTVKLEPPSPERPNNFLSSDYVSQLEHKKREEEPNSFHIKLEPVDREENFSSPDLSPDSPLSSSSGSYLPLVPSPIPSQVLKDEDVSAFRNTLVKSEDKQKQLQLIKLSQIRSAFSNINRSNERPKSIGQMFALKKRIKQAQLNGDSSLSENSKRFRAILPDGKVSIQID